MKIKWEFITNLNAANLFHWSPITFDYNPRAHSAFIPSRHKSGGGGGGHGRNWDLPFANIHEQPFTIYYHCRIINFQLWLLGSSRSVLDVLSRPVRSLSRVSIRQLWNFLRHFMTWCTIITPPQYTCFNWLWISTGKYVSTIKTESRFTGKSLKCRCYYTSTYPRNSMWLTVAPSVVYWPCCKRYPLPVNKMFDWR